MGAGQYHDSVVTAAADSGNGYALDLVTRSENSIRHSTDGESG
jgi:hypothetical protein